MKILLLLLQENIVWTKWFLGILAVLICAGIIAVAKIVVGKVSKSELENTIKDFDGDIKAINVRIDNFFTQLAQSVSKTDLIKDLGVAATRSDDKEIRVNRDVAELKTDLKALTEKVTMVDKKLDEIPARVASLELSRNKQRD